MMRSKHVKLVLALVVVVVALAAFAPVASAGIQTRIAYAQENNDYYVFQATTAGNLVVTGGWGPYNGDPAPIDPVAMVNFGINTGPAGDPYADLNVTDLYASGVNPVSNVATPVALIAGQKAYILVEPYIGDVPYSMTATFTGTGTLWLGKDGTGATDTTSPYGPVTGMAYASDGEVYIRSTGQWYGCGQYWPGTYPNNTLTNWNLYGYERSDYASGNWLEWTYPWTMESNTAQLYTGSGMVGSSTFASGAIQPANINRWYAIQWQTWGSNLVPNEWPSAPADPTWPIPKPASADATLAPLWATYSFPDTAAAKPGYAFATTALASASKRSFSSDGAVAATISWRYQGPNFSWVYETSSTGGIAKVTIDGGAPILVDQYSSPAAFKVKTDFAVGGLDTTWHDVVITGNGTRNVGNTTGFFLYHDAFVDPLDVTPYAENNYDGMTVYSWPKTTHASANGGAFVSTMSATGATAFTADFTNNTAANRTFKWTYEKSATGGIVNVYIDGAFQGTVDQYNATASFGNVYTSAQLAKGYHTIFVVGTGTRNAANTTGFFIYSDCWQAETQAIVQAE